jgi:hypothetical protein
LLLILAQPKKVRKLEKYAQATTRLTKLLKYGWFSGKLPALWNRWAAKKVQKLKKTQKL